MDALVYHGIFAVGRNQYGKTLVFLGWRGQRQVTPA
jgi:hypothetical protein